ncbi:hypothetical protein ERO13_D12G194350v2 [Gossypium hirsutum]|nr:hypothetical protein ERO13_D12G194350v2 [Gossypium hirsutum]
MRTTSDFNLFSYDNGEGRNPTARYDVRRPAVTWRGRVVDMEGTEGHVRAEARVGSGSKAWFVLGQCLFATLGFALGFQLLILHRWASNWLLG